MTREQFKKSLTKDGILWRENRGKIIVTSDSGNRGSVFMVDYDSIPVSLEFENRGEVYFSDSIIPQGTLFRNSGSVHITGDVVLEGVIFENGRDVILAGEYSRILSGTRFSNEGSIFFDSPIKSISPGVGFNQKGYISPSYRNQELKIHDSQLEIRGIAYKKILNLMVEEGIFYRE